jgi:hypothetical protein
MYCPNCRAEYVDGITECPDCHIPLVEELLEETEPKDFLPYVKVLATFNSADLIVIKSLLENAGLDYYIEGENFHYLGIPPAQAVKLVVREDQVETAKELLSGLDLRGWAVARSDEFDEDAEPDNDQTS